MLTTALCPLPGIEHPILAAGVDAVIAQGHEAGAPQRVLRNTAYRRREAAGRSPSGQRPGEGQTAGAMSSGGSPVERPACSAHVPGVDAEAMRDEMALYAGESCGLVNGLRRGG